MKRKIMVMFLLVGVLTQVFAQSPQITQARAVEIARGFLANFSPGPSDLLHAVMITRHNRLMWDIELWRDLTEFEFYIDAFTGEVVGFEMEQHAAPRLVHPSVNIPQHSLAVSVASAQSIALGVTGGGTVTEHSLGFYHGFSVHRFEINTGISRLQVFVNSATGEVMRLRNRR